MGQYPWGFTGVTPNASDNIPDKGSYNGHSLVFTDDGALPGAPAHHYAALEALVEARLGRDRGPILGAHPVTGVRETSRVRPLSPSRRTATTARSAAAPVAS